MSDNTTRGRHSASVSASSRVVVGELERTTVLPDGSMQTDRLSLREKVNRPPHPYGDFAVLSLSTISRIATEVSVTLGREMGVRDFRVFLQVLGSVGFANFVPLSASAMSRDLGIDRAHVSRSLKKLVTLGILMPDRLNEKPGKARRYYLAPSLVWKGSTVDLARIQEQERRDSTSVVKAKARRAAATKSRSSAPPSSIPLDTLALFQDDPQAASTDV